METHLLAWLGEDTATDLGLRYGFSVDTDDVGLDVIRLATHTAGHQYLRWYVPSEHFQTPLRICARLPDALVAACLLRPQAWPELVRRCPDPYVWVWPVLQDIYFRVPLYRVPAAAWPTFSKGAIA